MTANRTDTAFNVVNGRGLGRPTKIRLSLESRRSPPVLASRSETPRSRCSHGSCLATQFVFPRRSQPQAGADLRLIGSAARSERRRRQIFESPFEEPAFRANRQTPLPSPYQSFKLLLSSEPRTLISRSSSFSWFSRARRSCLACVRLRASRRRSGVSACFRRSIGSVPV